MQSTTTTVTASDGIPSHPPLAARRTPEAVVQIAHGVAEHSARYARLAEALTAAGYAVYANDHRGHGRTGEDADHGYFADQDGWATVVDDLRAVTASPRRSTPDCRSSSSGTPWARSWPAAYVIEDSRDLAGLVLSGTAGDPGCSARSGSPSPRPRRGCEAAGTCPLLDKLTFGQYNAAFKPNRTDFDWLSRDEAEVDHYVADPLCGDVLHLRASSPTWSAGWPESTTGGRSPACAATCRSCSVSGDKDPVGANGVGASRGGRAVPVGGRRRRHLHPLPGRAPRDLQRDQPRRGHRRPHRAGSTRTCPA